MNDELEVSVFHDGGVTVAPLGRRDVSIGRQPGCTVVIDDASLSRRHGTLTRQGDRVRVRDLASANGTTIREAPTTERAAPRLVPVKEDDAYVGVGGVVLFGTVPVVVLRRVAPTPLFVRDPVMATVHERIARIATSLISVLLLGEAGVGKDTLARVVHDRSQHASGPFVAVSCGALAPGAVESDLFGYEKGATPTALQAKPAAFEAASGGTLLLDDVGELSPDLQARLVKVLEARAVTRAGGREAHGFDVRIVAATHRDLGAECKAGRFRQDLFFRLDGMTVTVPPLRDRPAELMQLATQFFEPASLACGRATPPALCEGVRAAILRHAWPGNVRELRAAMEYAAALATGPEVLLEHLPERVAKSPEKVDDAEAARIADALAKCEDNQGRAAELLGITRRTLVAKELAARLAKKR